MAYELLSPRRVPKETAASLRTGEPVADHEFDRVYAPAWRSLSNRHWTPVAVATRAARLLTQMGATRVLDVGSGPGKFCIVGALTTSAHFDGIEQRPALVKAARMAALKFGAQRARFVQANILDFDFSPFDAFYLFNPFYEHVGGDLPPIDGTLELSPITYRTYVTATVAKLAPLAAGTTVVTYHGFGGVLPAEYIRVHRENVGSDELVVWVKSRRQKRAPGRDRSTTLGLADAAA